MNYAFEIKHGVITFVVQNTMYTLDKKHKNFNDILNCLLCEQYSKAYGYLDFKDFPVMYKAEGLYRSLEKLEYYYDGLLINNKLANFMETQSSISLNKYTKLLEKILLSHVQAKIVDFVLDNNVLLYTDGDIMVMHDSGLNYYDDLPKTYHIVPYDSNNSHLPIVKVHPGHIVDIVNNSLVYVTSFDDFGVKYV